MKYLKCTKCNRIGLSSEYIHLRKFGSLIIDVKSNLCLDCLG